MIKITSLNKIYKSKKRKVCHALKDINLTLPDAGLVFVLGKSGSGKSTLLNLIGGLDNITSGSIEVDGNDLAKFREGDFCNYRNTHIGFIFQDYHLIDELTVYENIVLSLNLRRIEDRDLVKAALEKVDLAGYEDRYPTELSGGERQRVAIARAIVKNPRIILADEPTGNLDTHTAKSIVELLKDLSKDCLILIVSHNVNDANNYADRIIELKNGEIISDRSRNPDFADHMTLENGELVYPDGLTLKDKDIEFINNNLSKFIKRTDKFISTPENKDKAKNVKIERKNLSLGKKLNLSGKFLKNKSIAILLSAFMVAVIMTILALAQTIAAFDGGHIIADEMAKSNQSSLLLNKVVDKETQARLDGNYRVEIGENDVQAFYDAGYKGKVYPVLNISLPISEYRNFVGVEHSYFSGTSLYIRESLGTIIVDEEFINHKFGQLTYLAKLKEFDPAGVIITDYVADSLIMGDPSKRYKNYDDVIGNHSFSTWSIGHCVINAVIDTGYKDRYQQLFDKIKNNEYTSATEIFQDDDAITFISEVYEKLGYSFTFNTDFATDYARLTSKGKIFRQKLVINDSIEIIGEDIVKYYVTRGIMPDNFLRDAWRYTKSAPAIPEGAKYIRVAFGVTSKEFDASENPLYSLFELDNAILEFSDGTSPTPAQLNYINSTWLSLDGTEIDKGSSWPKSQLSDYIEIPYGCIIKSFVTYVANGNAYCAFYDEDKKFISSYSPLDYEQKADSTISMTYNTYNNIFGTNYTEKNYKSFEPHTIKLSHYRFSDVDKANLLLEVEVTIDGLTSGTSSSWLLSDDLSDVFAFDQIYCYALYLDGIDGIGTVLDLTDELNYEHQSYAVEGIHSMTRAVDVFVPIFEFISIFLYIGVIFILMNFSSKAINDKMHEIGILKALGTKNGTIGVVFGLQVMLIALLTCGLSTLGYYLFIDVANDILIASVHRIAPSWNLPELQFLVFEWKIALMNCALTLGLAILSLIAPMIKIKAIKPVKIIKAKE